MGTLIDLPEQEKRQYAQQALKVVTSNSLPKVAAALAALMIENAKLLRDDQRLRQIAGEEPLPEFKIQ